MLHHLLNTRGAYSRKILLRETCTVTAFCEMFSSHFRGFDFLFLTLVLPLKMTIMLFGITYWCRLHINLRLFVKYY